MLGFGGETVLKENWGNERIEFIYKGKQPVGKTVGKIGASLKRHELNAPRNFCLPVRTKTYINTRSG